MAESTRLRRVFPLAVLLALYGCNSNPAGPNTDGSSIKFSIKSIGATISAGKVASPQVTSVTITSVRVVIDEIKLKSSLDDTLNFKLEDPFVQDLLGGTTSHEITTVQVPPGTYKELEVEIDELKPEHGAVFTENPELQNWSILVTGFLDGDSAKTFTFASDLEEEQEQEFKPPIVLDEASPSTNVVLTVDMDSWFVDGNGGFLDPALAQNKSRIEENIKNSIDVFEDRDDDGKKDDD